MAKEKPDKKEVGATRVYSKDVEFDHDLFELKPSSMVKDMSYSTIPDFVKLVHQHMFHTIDSDGTVQTRCNPTGGHFHLMEVTPQENGLPPIVKCSRAKKVVRKRVNGMDANAVVDIEFDDHTHDVTYKRSDKITVRAVNAEAMKVVTDEANKTRPVNGIIG